MNNPTIVLFYLFLVLFTVTAIITLLGITGIIKTIKDKYLNALFTALILEVVAAVIFSYKQINLGADSSSSIDKLIVISGNKVEGSEGEKFLLLEDLVKEYKHMKPGYDEYKTEHDSILNALKLCTKELNDADKSYYMKIIKLRLITRNEMDGTTINLVFDQEKKKEVFSILTDIFMMLGQIDPSANTSTQYIVDVYLKFLKRYNLQESLVTKNENNITTGVYLTDYVTSLMIRAYLEKFYPIR